MKTRQYLAEVARKAALTPFHGYLDGEETNLHPLVKPFPKWNIETVDRLWCAAFVYYCCTKAGFEIPYSPDECISCSLAGCGGWEEYAMADRRIGYFRNDPSFVPEPGDIVLYDRVFCNREHDHIGIVLEVYEDHLLTAEGNIFQENIFGLVERLRDEHIRAYIRIPDDYRYFE